MNDLILERYLYTFNYVEKIQKTSKINYNYMNLNFNESPIPTIPKWNFFKENDINVTKANRFSYVPAHTHSFIELNYMYSGRCTQSLNNEDFDFTQGQLLIMDKNTVQKIGYTGQEDILINILIKDSVTINRLLDYLKGYENKISLFLSQTNLKTNSNNFIICDLNSSPIAQSLIKNIISLEMATNNVNKNRITIDLLFSTLLIQLEDTIQYYKNDFNSNDSNILEILKYIEHNYSSTNLKLTSEHFGYNMNYLSNKIKSSTGQTYKEIIEQRRLYAAQDLLYRTKLSLEDISMKIGYKNPSSLHRLFKKYINITPIDYRHQLISNNHINNS
ncbi:helix-turn-helix domain-containing protein [Pediococcus pentosaceus]|uniref:AraC family transcriptional regulator n=1 Tax=Pediococcus pentosaceus TaxID=1255 RepID=UPI00132F798A|nr:AraC family transcriptional regulator [Pediococcus pentosaceus]KAF0468303.1 helix-turn-helix domain-containing protein [Pediococcus pentosaceus]